MSRAVESLIASLPAAIEAGRVPARIFSDPDLFTLELERVFGCTWIFLGHETEIERSGDYVVRHLGDDSIILIRDDAGAVRCFLNSCRHRGTQLATAERGNRSYFVCPYHGWTYRNSGELTGVTALAEAYRDSLDRSQWGLVEARVGTYAGLIFGTWNATTPNLEEYFGGMTWYLDLIARRTDGGMKVVGPPHRFEVDANWKLGADNFVGDGYHIPTVHRDSLARWKATNAELPPPKGNYTAAFAMHKGSQLLLPFPGYEGFAPMPQIAENRKEGTFFTTVRPTMMMTLGNDGALAFRCEPLSATRSRLMISSLFPRSTLARNDFEEIAKNYYRRNDIVVGEDVAISLRQQAGIQSPYARMARLCESEMPLNRIANWILDRVVPETDSGQAAAQ